ncbi:bacteriocin immunity protein [Pseudomonas sp. NPDC079086]|uniref:bacteriocin immunity protein n=1 Tax=unclassified Pseudomonas TaxID=196821 RepID=UPI0037CB1BEC
MDFLSKRSIEDYTEAEFMLLLREFFEDTNGLKGAALESHLSQLTDHFVGIVGHPQGSDLIFYPGLGVDDSPEGVLSEVKKWRHANGLPSFKAS